MGAQPGDGGQPRHPGERRLTLTAWIGSTWALDATGQWAWTRGPSKRTKELEEKLADSTDADAEESDDDEPPRTTRSGAARHSAKSLPRICEDLSAGGSGEGGGNRIRVLGGRPTVHWWAVAHVRVPKSPLGHQHRAGPAVDDRELSPQRPSAVWTSTSNAAPAAISGSAAA